jgi:hypothetical protein
MLRTLFAVVVILHGLVHLWFVVLSQQLVPFQPEMGWTGRSWLFTGLIGDTATRWLATIVYSLATVAFLTGGTGLLTQGTWWRPVLTGAALSSAVAILLFWDGVPALLVQRGLIGFLLDLVILVVVLVLRWPAARS